MAVLEQATLISEEAEYGSGKHTVRRTYLVKADSSLEAQVNALAKAAPAGLTALTANTRYTDAKVSSTRFNVEISYGVASATDLRKQEEQGNPLDWEPKISYPNEESEEPYFKDTEDTPAVNSAAQPFENPPTRRRTRMVIQVEVNVPEGTFDPLVLAAYADTRNGNVVTIDGVTYPTSTLLMSAPQASAKQKWTDATTVIEYRTITFRLLIDPDNNWSDMVADTGCDELIDGKWVPIVDEYGQKVTAPVPLDGNGRKATGDGATLELVPYLASTWSNADFGG